MLLMANKWWWWWSAACPEQQSWLNKEQTAATRPLSAYWTLNCALSTT